MNNLTEMKLNNLKEEAAFYEEGLKTCEPYEKDFYEGMAKTTKENLERFEQGLKEES